MDPFWSARAKCGSGDPEAHFVEQSQQHITKRMCRTCPVKVECLADSLDSQVNFGMWGGLTEGERRKLLRRYPNVKSWWLLFAKAERHNWIAPPKKKGAVHRDSVPAAS